MNTLSYINKKGKEIQIEISLHAKQRFIKRYNRIFINNPIMDIDSFNKNIKKIWETAKLKNRKNRKELERLEKHGLDTLYFVSNYFTFVVQNATLITVELGSKDTKHLNNKDGTSPLKLCEYYKNHNFKKILTLSEFEKIRKDYRQDLDKN